MKAIRNIVSALSLMVPLFAGVLPVSASASTATTHQVVNEPVSWTLDPSYCKQINVVILGNGQRHEEIETSPTQDGGTLMITEDRVSGTATDANGATYQFLYVNHASWLTSASGTMVSIQMNDLFLLKGDSLDGNNLRVAFKWSWTYDPLTSADWPPVDNFVKTFTTGDPYNCDPI